MEKFMLSWVEHERSFITSGPEDTKETAQPRSAVLPGHQKKKRNQTITKQTPHMKP